MNIYNAKTRDSREPNSTKTISVSSTTVIYYHFQSRDQQDRETQEATMSVCMYVTKDN